MKKVIFLVVALTTTFNCLVVEANEPAAISETQSGVRTPAGDTEKFWENFDWGDLSADEQRLWSILGWNAQTWQGDGSQAPVSDRTDWDKLSQEEQAAASALGFDKSRWDKD